MHLHLPPTHARLPASLRGGLLTHTLAALLGRCFRVAIYSRLYEQAIQQREKLEVRKAERDVQEAAALAAQRVSMSWISSEMMRDRTSGPYDNYGEMLYAESLEALARRHERVRARLLLLLLLLQHVYLRGGGSAVASYPLPTACSRRKALLLASQQGSPA